MATRVSTILDRKGRDVWTIAPDATVAEATDTLAEHDVGALVVSSDGSSVEGIVSERDIVRQLTRIGAECLELSVREVMSEEVTTCTAEDTADDLMAAMTSGRMRHVPVLDDDESLAGIISIGDVVKSRIEELETQAESLQEYVTGNAY